MAGKDTAQRDLDEATRFVLAHPESRLFLWWVLGKCHLFGSSMTGNSYSFHLEGERNIGLQLVAQLSAVSPTAFPKLMIEMASVENEDNHVSEVDD